MIVISPSESQILAALRAFLLAALPTVDAPNAWDVVLGQDNQVGEPSTKNFVAMWPILRPRLATNVDEGVDTAFAGSIAGTVLTISAVSQGLPAQGATLFGASVAAGSIIGAPISTSPDGTGTWAVSPSQTVASETMASGEATVTQETEIVVQCDVHAADLKQAGDAAARVSTLFRDPFAVDVMAATTPGVAPLYADDPRQSPFVNAEQQYESRWSVDLHLQTNQTVSGIPQQFMTSAEVETVSVETLPSP